MADIPDHLIGPAWEAFLAADEANQGYEEALRAVIAAVLAALRPEDAPLVDAWLIDRKFLATVFRIQTERDEARAEVERLKAALDKHMDAE